MKEFIFVYNTINSRGSLGSLRYNTACNMYCLLPEKILGTYSEF